MNFTHALTIALVAWFCAVAIARAQAGNERPMDIDDGFETGSLGNLWSDDWFEAGAVEMEANVEHDLSLCNSG